MNDTSGKVPSYACQPDADHHCLTCADEAVPVKVVRIDQEAGLALCSPCSPRRDSGLSLSARAHPHYPDQTQEIDSPCSPRRDSGLSLSASAHPHYTDQTQEIDSPCSPRRDSGLSLSASAHPHYPDQTQEIDITLVEDVAVGDILLAHAGVAIARQEKE